MHSAVLVLALLDLSGYVAARGVNATGPASWLDGGWGRLEAGGDRDEFFGDSRCSNMAQTTAKRFRQKVL